MASHSNADHRSWRDHLRFLAMVVGFLSPVWAPLFVMGYFDGRDQTLRNALMVVATLAGIWVSYKIIASPPQR